VIECLLRSAFKIDIEWVCCQASKRLTTGKVREADGRTLTKVSDFMGEIVKFPISLTVTIVAGNSLLQAVSGMCFVQNSAR
jgi:hypothetical protein